MPVYKDKKRNTWYVKYQQTTKRGFQSKREAKAFEKSIQDNFSKPKTKQTKYLFSFVANDFLDLLKTDISLSSYSLYRQIVNDNILPLFKNKYINDIDERDCKSFREYVISLPYSTRRRNRVLHLFKRIFNHACEYFELTHNPTSVIKTINTEYEERINRKNKSFNIWTNEEFEKFISCISKEEYKCLFITLFYTGLRLGEALALNWNDLKEDYLLITKSNSKVSENGNYEIKYPKNISSIRDVYINKSLHDYLWKTKVEQMKEDDFSESWFIFGGKKPLCRTTIERIKNKGVLKSGVKKIRIHDFRHSHASILIGEGVDIVAVSKRLGHSDINMTLKIYTHLLDKNNNKLVNFIEESSHNLLTSSKKMLKDDT